MLRSEWYVCKYVKMSEKSYAQILFPASFASQRVPNSDTFASIKQITKKSIWQTRLLINCIWQTPNLSIAGSTNILGLPFAV